VTPACPLCGDPRVAPFVRRMTVPVLQNAPAATRDEARGRAMGALEIAACERCGFVFNRGFDPARIEYAQSYDNTQCCSPSFERYMRELAADLVARHDLRGKRIVEIGCGKGHFLRMLCAAGGNRGFGLDPTYVGPDQVDGGAVTFVREFYAARHGGLGADFVCCRHVLEHVADPMAMLSQVRLAAGDPRTSVFFEVPTVDWILDHTCFWDFFYEHCNYFNAQTLGFAFRRAGFEVARTQAAFEGQYLWLEARPGPPPGAVEVAPTGVAESLARIRAFEARAEAGFAHWQDRFRHAAAHGGLAIWGAGAKGVTLANLLDPDAALIKYVIDINPNKQHTFVPGTGHPIVGPEALARDRVGHVFITNPNYAGEIRATIGALAGGDLVIDCL